MEDFWHELATYEHTCTCAVTDFPPCSHCESCTVCNCALCRDVHDTKNGEECPCCTACSEDHPGPKDEDCRMGIVISSGLTEGGLLSVFSGITGRDDGARVAELARVVAQDCVALLQTVGLHNAASYIQNDYELGVKGTNE